MTSIGIRELKANLSKTLRAVQKGARVEVTERGQPIAILIPIGPASDLSWAHRLVVEKRAQWNGGKPSAYLGKPIGLKTGKKLASDLVIEGRRK
jgi:prevent-host-death family protein